MVAVLTAVAQMVAAVLTAVAQMVAAVRTAVELTVAVQERAVVPAEPKVLTAQLPVPVARAVLVISPQKARMNARPDLAKNSTSPLVDSMKY